MNLHALSLLKVLAVACLAIGLAGGVGALLLARDTALHRAYFRYVADLERRMRLLFIERPAQQVLLAQVAGVVGCFTAALLTRRASWLIGLPVIAVVPGLVLEHMRKTRVAQIEHKLDSFVVALANALRASPSAGRALAMIQPVTPAPLDREIALVLREMRVGSTLEQALGNLSARVRSFQLDAAMSGLLIGRQTGGNVPAILDGAAQTLREIARLQGVLRSKTAEGRAQANVLAFAPAVLIFAFDRASPGYFRPLTDSAIGLLITGIAMLMWIGSVLMTRRIMAVEL